MVSAASPWEKTVVSLGTCTTTFPSPASARKSATRNPVSLTRRSAPFGLPLMTAARRFTRAAAWPLLFAVFAPAARIVFGTSDQYLTTQMGYLSVQSGTLEAWSIDRAAHSISRRAEPRLRRRLGCKFSAPANDQYPRASQDHCRANDR